MAKPKTPPTLRDQVERLIAEYICLDQRADDAIDAYAGRAEAKMSRRAHRGVAPVRI
jgi:hypothetical protein